MVVAIVGASSAIAGVVVTQWFEASRERHRARADGDRMRAAYANDQSIRSETFIREIRAKQAERIRNWLEHRLVASIDVEHLNAAANVRGDPIAQAAALDAAQTIAATVSSDDGRSPSINAALSGVTDEEIVRSVRRVSGYNLKFRENLLPLRRFLGSNPMPWNDEKAQELRALGEELRDYQNRFDSALVELYGDLERYCLGIEY